MLFLRKSEISAALSSRDWNVPRLLIVTIGHIMWRVTGHAGHRSIWYRDCVTLWRASSLTPGLTRAAFIPATEERAEHHQSRSARPGDNFVASDLSDPIIPSSHLSWSSSRWRPVSPWPRHSGPHSRRSVSTLYHQKICKIKVKSYNNQSRSHWPPGIAASVGWTSYKAVRFFFYFNTESLLLTFRRLT